jgi:hypothetical protein
VITDRGPLRRLRALANLAIHGAGAMRLIAEILALVLLSVLILIPLRWLLDVIKRSGLSAQLLYLLTGI